jgi:hypothetical protein
MKNQPPKKTLTGRQLVIILLLKITLIVLVAKLYSCTPLRFDCATPRLLPVTIILPDSTTRTIDMPWCDTIRTKKAIKKPA